MTELPCCSKRVAKSKARWDAFRAEGQRDKAAKMLAVIDRSCKVCGLPIPVGEAGVKWLLERDALSMHVVRVEAKLDRPPSSETFGELLKLVRNR